jgi:hypothetical protein|tara:strand:+ start:66 stop:407 length:342 start_codon:yes stop_codon:yes gene_type:complete
MDGPIIQTDVESRLLRCVSRLEEETERYAEVSEARARAEAEFKRRYFTALVSQGKVETVARREAFAHLQAKDEFSDWKLFEAQEKATQQALIAVRTQIEALRTLSANVRAMGG